MKRLGKIALTALTTGALISIFSIHSFAATKKSISTVSLSFETDIQVGASVDEDVVEVTAKSEKYQVGECEFTGAGFSWELTDVPEMIVTLYAAEGYRFTLSSKSDVKLSGGGATYVKATKRENWETLELTIKLAPLSESIGEIEEAQWASVGMASWSPVLGAGGYEVRLYRDGSGNSVGTSKVTSDTTYDFSSIMTRPAGYSFRVRAVNATKTDIKSSWFESNMIMIDSDQAALFRAGATAQGWKQDAVGWWYQNSDGSYTKDNWQMINDKWYFFNSQGYMVTGWVSWNNQTYFCTDSGEMLTNTTTPDGHHVDISGVRVD